MTDDKSKDDVKILGEFLRDRAPSVEEEERVVERVWHQMGSKDAPLHVRHDFHRTQVRSSMSRFVWAGVAAVAVVSVVLAGMLFRPASPARIESAEGSLERVNEKATQAVQAGEKLAFGEIVRSGTRTSVVLALNDGSKIEMRSNSELVLEKADDGVRIRLNGGGIFVTAAKQHAGHLYVQTRDVTVSVVGTVFFVNAEEAGSRVAVVEGEVQVRQGEKSSRLLPGEQVATNPLMAPHPVVEQLAWSHSAEPYLAPLQQPKRLEFEVATLRFVPSGGGRFVSRPRCRGTDGEFRPAGINAPPVPLGRCVSDDALLQMFLEVAYDIEGLRISGLPPFQEQPTYQLEAKAEDPAKTTREDLRQMLQNFLADQFKLKVHRETKEMDGYVLTIGNEGVKFKESSGDEQLPSWQPSGAPRIDSTEQALPTIVKGVFRMPRFVNALSLTANLPIADKTGLAGLYDMSFAIDLILRNPGGAGGPRGGGGGRNPQEFNPPLPKALEEQLGLHLERAKVPVEFLVVDHFEKAPAN
jgi:uncharacterized protein (TIGR03435 family)